MPQIHPLYVPLPFQDVPERGRVILRDGTTADLRAARREDLQAFQAFFRCLSPDARQRRFLSLAVPAPDLIGFLCDSSNPKSTMTLLVTRCPHEERKIIATASYQALNEKTAEISFAVDDAHRGQGLGTLLLERLAVIAAHNGFSSLRALTHCENRAMLEVFHASGFEVKETWDHGYVELELSTRPSAASVTRSEVRDRIATIASLRAFFRPSSVALVGASRKIGSIGWRILDALVHAQFQGPVYPINPHADWLYGLHAFPSIQSVPGPVDLAMIAVPRSGVLQTIDQCADHGVRAVIVITAGYAETGLEGQKLQDQLVERVRGYGMRLIGPNCLGILNTDPVVRLNASFAPVFPPRGRVAMSSQSGALGLAVIAAACRNQVGFSAFVSVGNKADVSPNDLLQYWEDDPQTGVILLYLESFGNPRRFKHIARRVSLRKPVIAVKAGKTPAGSRAAGSHTAALADRDSAVAALFEQNGVIRADTLEEMLDLALALSHQPPPAGPRVAIITNAGGPAILCADACEAAGMQVPQFSPVMMRKLSTALPAAASTANPIDMIASAGPAEYGRTVETVLASGEVDALVVIHITAGLADQKAVAQAIGEAVSRARTAGAAGKTVLACWMSETALPGRLPCAGETIPTFPFPETPAHILAKAWRYACWRDKVPGAFLDFDDMDLDQAGKVCNEALASRGNGWLTAKENRTVLEAVRLPITGKVMQTAADAVELARSIGYPVALKLASHILVHKTEMGGVHLNVTDDDGVRCAFDQICNRLASNNQQSAMEGVVVQPMVAGGVEVMIGVQRDPRFGPLIAFGLGGIHVEILNDVCFRLAPLTDRDAREMIEGIRGYRLLDGYRGGPAADIEALQEILLRVSRLVDDVPAIDSVDLNPVFALAPGKGCCIVDARIHIEAKPSAR
jgi:acetyl coenzyme A synthetase (ADP forming)-like protein